MKTDDRTRPPLADVTTLSEDDAQAADSPSLSPSDRLALAVVWSKDEAWRIGETLLLPEDPESTVWFGRGPNVVGTPLKGTLGQQRPGQWVPCPVVATPAISRHQLSFRRVGPDLVVQNEGKVALLRNGGETSGCELVAGDLLQLGKQILFLCCSRSAQIADDDGAYPSFSFGLADPYGLVGESPPIWELRRKIAFAAARPDHVAVVGESGSGKELVAQAIHSLSSRGRRRLLARNAATLPETLIDAELFGNAKGYPNPGMAERAGLVGEANGSTLFLDEIAELPHPAQAHLLRVLDHGEYQRLGEANARISDFRLIAATNRDLASLKAEFLARLTIRIAVPSLNARKEDLPLLVRYSLRRMAQRGDSLALNMFPGRDPCAYPRVPLSWVSGLLKHHYRTNVRELESMLIAALANPEVVTTWGKRSTDAETETSPMSEMSPTASSSAETIRRCLEANNGSIEHTWRALGLSSRFTLLRLIKKYGLEVRRKPAQGQRPGDRS